MPEYEVWGRPEKVEGESVEDALLGYRLTHAVCAEPLDEETGQEVHHEMLYDHAEESKAAGDCRCINCVEMTLNVMADLGFFVRHPDGTYSLREVDVLSRDPNVGNVKVDFFEVFKVWALEAFGVEVK
jgi:hypothetical protein